MTRIPYLRLIERRSGRRDLTHTVEFATYSELNAALAALHHYEPPPGGAEYLLGGSGDRDERRGAPLEPRAWSEFLVAYSRWHSTYASSAAQQASSVSVPAPKMLEPGGMDSTASGPLTLEERRALTAKYRRRAAPPYTDHVVLSDAARWAIFTLTAIAGFAFIAWCVRHWS